MQLTLRQGIENVKDTSEQEQTFSPVSHNVVLTQKNVEGKLEGMNLTQEGKRSCKRHSGHLRKNSK